MDCMGCGLDGVRRHYKINRTGKVYTQVRCDLCHDYYLMKKTGVSESTVSPAPDAPYVRPVPQTIDRVVGQRSPGDWSYSTGKNGTVVERDGSKVVFPRSMDRNKVLAKASRQRRPVGLGAMARARVLSRGGK